MMVENKGTKQVKAQTRALKNSKGIEDTEEIDNKERSSGKSIVGS